MKVYVTQGHENGIGLEVFFKSIVLMPEDDVAKIQLVAFKESVAKTLKSLKLPYNLLEDKIDLAGVSVKTYWLSEVNFSESFTALDLGMKLCERGGILFTLPTSKDQFPGFPGHTEYFRSYYQRPDLGMFFLSPELKVLLLSDHVAIKDLSVLMTKSLIQKRLTTAINSLKSIGISINRVLVSGLNPHAGESGLIGHEDKRITSALNEIRTKYKMNINGPLPGDTMLLEKKTYDDLLVYLFHDQGLGVFKGIQGLIGANITLGLPYSRLSPDHGTSFGLYGKNSADYRGCAYALGKAVALLK